MLACVLYAALGTPDALMTQVVPPPAAAIGPVQIEGMAQRLADRLKTQLDDVEGWRKLARSYETLRRFNAAAGAYRQIIRLEPHSLDAVVDYAVVLGMTLGGKLAAEPEQQLLAVLGHDPAHLQALALAGSAATRRKRVAENVTRAEAD